LYTLFPGRPDNQAEQGGLIQYVDMVAQSEDRTALASFPRYIFLGCNHASEHDAEFGNAGGKCAIIQQAPLPALAALDGNRRVAHVPLHAAPFHHLVASDELRVLTIELRFRTRGETQSKNSICHGISE
jgi:hypothetical protein